MSDARARSSALSPRGARTEEPYRLRHRNTVLADAPGDLVVRDPELFGEPLQTARLLDGIEVGALQVLDEAEHELLIAARVGADHGRHAGEASHARGPPPALAGDELVAVEMPADEQWL